MEKAIKEAQKALDEFNLEVAKYRVNAGMSQGLVNLYASMGRLSNTLIEAECSAMGIRSNFEKLGAKL